MGSEISIKSLKNVIDFFIETFTIHENAVNFLFSKSVAL